MAKDTGFEIIINEGHNHIHQQYGKGNAVRVATPAANDIDQDTDAYTKDQSALGAGCCGDGIGSDEKGTQDGRATEQVK